MTKHSENAPDIVERCQRIISLVEQNGPHILLKNEVRALNDMTEDYKPYTSPVRLVLSPEEEAEQEARIEQITQDIEQLLLDKLMQLKPRDNHDNEPPN
jgi:hypothetical protein